MKTFLLAILVALALNVNAAVLNETTSDRVDERFLNFYETNLDSVTGLEWLSFTTLINGEKTDFTMGHTIESALEAYAPQGWRLATTEQVYDLFDFFYPTYDGGTIGKMELFDAADPTADIIESRNSWLMSFGTYIDAENDLHSRGWYLDEGGNAQLMGAILNTDPLSSYLYGADWDLTGKTITSQYDNVGVFLVRDFTVVPIPAAIWLFGTGLIALLGIARRKS